MPTPSEQQNEAAEAHRLAQAAVAAQAAQSVTALWPLLLAGGPDAWVNWSRLMRVLIHGYRGRSAGLAGAYYRHVRAVALPGIPAVAPVDRSVPDTGDFDGWIDRALGYAGPGTLRDLKSVPEKANPTALTRVVGTAERIVLDGGRETLHDTVRADPKALGWFRVTDGDPCYFCAMLASRGPVYKRDSFDRSDPRFVGTGDAKVHNHCGCTLAPVFSRTQQLPLLNRRMADLWSRSTAGASGSGKALDFRRAYEGRVEGRRLGPRKTDTTPVEVAPAQAARVRSILDQLSAAVDANR